MLAKELLSRPDDFISVLVGEEEYVIDGIKKIFTHVNIDDDTSHLTIQTRKSNGGSILR
jgi:hypothetical protein